MTFGGFPRQFAFSTTAAATLLAILLCVSPAFAQKSLVYINSNISATGQNSVIALQNDGSGNLTPLAGSPYLTGGTGVVTTGSGVQLDSDQEVIVNPEGTLLFAVNGDSNTVAVFQIHTNGELTAVSGSPFSSGGQEPASLAYADNVFGTGSSRLIVVNQAADPLQSGGTPNYTTFGISPAGALLLGSSYNLPAGSSPTQAIWRPGMAQFFGFDFMNANVATFNFTPNGAMTQVSSVTPSGSAPVIVGAVKNPVVNGLYIGLPAQNQLGVVSYGPSGALTAGGEVVTQGNTPCWLAINAAGTVLYDSETPAGTISVWNVTNSKKPVQLQHLSVSGTGALPGHMRVDPTGKFLYVLDRVGTLHVLNINSDGTVVENLAPYNLGLPSGTVPLGVAVLK